MKKLAMTYFMSKAEHYSIFDSLNFERSSVWISSFRASTVWLVKNWKKRVITDPKIYCYLLGIDICIFVYIIKHISSLPHLEIPFLVFFLVSHQSLQNAAWTFILKLPVTKCKHLLCRQMNSFNFILQVMILSWWSCKAGAAKFWSEFCTIIVFSTLNM